jgi:hypothetical protein
MSTMDITKHTELLAAECELADALAPESDHALCAMVERLAQKRSGMMTHRAMFAAARTGVLYELKRRHTIRKDHA